MLPPKDSFWAGASDQSPLTGHYFQVWFKKFTPQASQDMSDECQSNDTGYMISVLCLFEKNANKKVWLESF